MPEQIRPLGEPWASGPSADDLFDEAPAAGMATVSNSGLYTETLPVANMTVGQVRNRFADRLDIDAESHAEIDGQPVSDDVVIQTGQLLAFVRHAGEKG